MEGTVSMCNLSDTDGGGKEVCGRSCGGGGGVGVHTVGWVIFI
jgi:hypothetical protein